MRRELLLTVYKSAVDEYRFNVTLGWERTKFFLGLIVAMLSAGVGLLKFASDSIPVSVFLATYFYLIHIITKHAEATANRSKAYYREASYKKTLVERELGLLTPVNGLPHKQANLSLTVTEGSGDPVSVLFRTKLADRSSSEQFSAGSIANRLDGVTSAMRIIAWIGFGASLWSLAVSLMGCHKCTL